MATVSERAFVFAADPLLTVTVEAGGEADEIHLHAGGQGFWVAQMIANLRVDVSLCGPFGGESGRVVRSQITQEPRMNLRAIETAGIAAGLARASDLLDALRLGAAAAALNVTRRGLATGDRREIDRLAPHIDIHPREETRSRA